MDKDNYTLAQIAEKYNVCKDTILRWVKQGRISYIKLPTGIRRYHYKAETFQIQTEEKDQDTRRGIIYARVSSSKQRDDLHRQISVLEEQYPTYDLITDIGSGLNYKRKGLRRMVERVLEGSVSEVVVAYRDRLSRFSFEFFLWLFGKCETKIVVLANIITSPEQEMVQDLMSIITVFSCRANGFRKYRTQIKNDKDLSIGKPKIVFEEDDGNLKIDL